MGPASTKYLSKLSGQRVLILGGTSGIGFAVAEGALEHGAHVTVSSSNPDKVARAVERLRAAGGASSASSVTGQVCNLAQADRLEENLDELLKVAAGDSGKINHIVVTAVDGVNMTSVSDVTVEGIHQAGHVRFLAPMILAKLIPRYVDLSPTNSVTFTSGSSIYKPKPGFLLHIVYGSALEGLTRALAQELKPLRVNLVAPGLVQTELTGQLPGEQREAVFKKFKEESITGTIASPEDVAEAYIYCMKDKFVTGTILHTSGGHLIG